MKDARQLSNVIHHRIATGWTLDPRGDTYADWTPQVDDPQWAHYLATLAHAADTRRTELGELAAADAPKWALEAFGPPPADRDQHSKWVARVGTVAAHRELTDHHDDAIALGAPPKPGQVEAYASWRAAWRALGRPEPDRDEVEMSDGQLRLRVRAAAADSAIDPDTRAQLQQEAADAGKAAGTAHQAHRTVRTALNEAIRRNHIIRNPAVLAKPPRLTEEEIEPLTVEEVRRLLATAARSRNCARWAVALALGLRQGEALGLKWSDVDLTTGRLTIRRNRLRPAWEHGCSGTCGRKSGHCPQRYNTRPDTAETKSRAGRRAIGLPPELIELLREHQAEQNRERETARQLWQDGDWLFTDPTGGILNPRTDTKHWKELLTTASVRDARLHDARHTAATVLLLLGVPERAVMEVMGWSHSAMATRYQHVTTTIRGDIASRVGGLLWGTLKLPADETVHDGER